VYINYTALVPGQVQNLRSTLDTNAPTLTLHWDKPRNMTTGGDVKSYDIRFKPCGREGNYCQKTVVAPATSIILTRESGLKPLTKYILEVRARSDFQEGKWSGLSEYIGACLYFARSYIIESVDCIHRDSRDTQYMTVQPKQST